MKPVTEQIYAARLDKDGKMMYLMCKRHSNIVVFDEISRHAYKIMTAHFAIKWAVMDVVEQITAGMMVA